MIITCPHCQTKYQVTYEAIGSAGRKVQCAHCKQAWNQDPRPAQAAPAPRDAQTVENDTLFDAMAEDALDDIMASEEKAASGQGRAYKAPSGAVEPNVSAPAADPAPKIDAAALQKQQVAFRRRQNAMSSSLPLARLRRGARFAGVIILVGLVLGAWFGRVPIVERYPDLAGLYEAVGLGVNIVGLDFSDLHSIKSLSGGNDVLTVSAQIVGRSPAPVPVPPVVISLLDAAGNAVFEWSVAPQVRDLMAGERATFDTRLSLPPSEAVRVRLSFAGAGAGASTMPIGHQPAAAPVAEDHAAPEAETDHPAAEPAHAPAPASAEHH